MMEMGRKRGKIKNKEGKIWRKQGKRRKEERRRQEDIQGMSEKGKWQYVLEYCGITDKEEILEEDKRMGYNNEI